MALLFLDTIKRITYYGNESFPENGGSSNNVEKTPISDFCEKVYTQNREISRREREHSDAPGRSWANF
jgi:hypothetical protein